MVYTKMCKQVVYTQIKHKTVKAKTKIKKW